MNCFIDLENDWLANMTLSYHIQGVGGGEWNDLVIKNSIVSLLGGYWWWGQQQ